MTADLIPDLNTTIVAAVNARVEAEVAKALSGDETMGRLVGAALMQTVQVADGTLYGKERVPFLTAVLRSAIQDATKKAVTKLIAEEMDSIETEVRKAIRRDLAAIAGTLTQSLADAAAKPHGVDVRVALKMPNA